MKWCVYLTLAFFLASCSPAAVVSKSSSGNDFPLQSDELWSVVFNAPKEITFDFSLTGILRTDKNNWVYGRFKTTPPALAGSGVVPSDRKNLVMVFQVSSTEQLSCIVPLSELPRASKGIGAAYLNDRKTAGFPCGINKK